MTDRAAVPPQPAPNLDEVERCLSQYESAIGPGGEKAWCAAQLARKVPALVAEVKRLRAELDPPNDIESTGRCFCAGCVGMGPCDRDLGRTDD